MKSLEQWLLEYGESHQNRTNKLIHYLCVPAIFMTVIALLWSIPMPFELPSYVNAATIFLIPAMLFYLMLSIPLGIVLAVFSALCLVFVELWSVHMDMPVLQMAVVVFVVSWILQFLGHKIEGKKPSFFKDVQFLLIGPAWIACDCIGKVPSATEHVNDTEK